MSIDPPPEDRSIPLLPPEARHRKDRVANIWLSQYLDLLRSRSAELDLRLLGLNSHTPVSLEDVYTPLYGYVGQETTTLREQRTLLEEIVDSTPAMLLIGDSGSGKSTFLRHHANRLLQRRSETPFFLELVDLNNLANSIKSEGGKLPWDSIIRCLLQHLKDEGIDTNSQAIRQFVEENNVVWLLDGFNEIIDREMRVRIAEILHRNREMWPRSKFVVTATDTILRDGSAPASGAQGFQYVLISRFRREDVSEFLDRFANAYDTHLSDAERRSLWEPIARRLLSTPELRELITSPLYLTSIALVYLTTPQDPMAREIPIVRVDILEGVINWILARRKSYLPKLAGNSSLNVLAKLCYEMLIASPGPFRKVGILWAAQQVCDLPSFGGDVQAAEAYVRQLANSGVVISAMSLGDLTIQDTFRDYLASYHLVRELKPKEKWQSILAQHLDEPAWRLVNSLVPGQLLRLGTNEIDNFFRWLADISLDQQLEARLKRVALGGSVLKELKAANYSAAEIVSWQRLVNSIGDIFIRFLPEIPLHIRFEAAVAYGLYGDPRLSEIETGWAINPSSDYLIGAQSSNQSEPNYDPVSAPWEGPIFKAYIDEFFIRIFPVTVGEYRAFVDAGGYKEISGEYWDFPGQIWLNRTKVTSPKNWMEQLLLLNTPVTGVSWYEARAYCRWLTTYRHDGYTYRLPSELEWESAARRGTSKERVFPWGNSIAWADAAEANWAGALLRRKSPVGMFPCSTNIDGVADLFGNVEEWCLERWNFAAPHHLMIEELNAKLIEEEPKIMRIVKGGSCIRFSRLMRPSYRSRILEYSRYHTVGFRIVRIVNRTH